MFTGIVEQVATLAAIEAHSSHRTLRIVGLEVADLRVGDSIAINGVCLTATSVADGEVTVDVIPETLDRTNLGSLVEGSRLNLERPLRADGRFDGHIVQGHIDGVGVVAGVSRSDDGVSLEVDAPSSLMPYIVEKGSITVDGVSLTVAVVDDGGFEVALIPHTLEVTTLGLRDRGDAVNLEVDVLAKYVERLLEARK